VAISVFTSTSIDALADALAASLNHDAVDPFREVLLLTPNLPLKRWLTYQLAERRGITANIAMEYMEGGLWRFAETLPPDDSDTPTTRLNREWVQWMIVATLLAARPNDETFAPFFSYTGPLTDLTDRAVVRKLWQLADQLSRLFREYESAAPALTRTWLNANAAPRNSAPMWKAQRALYRFIFAKDGLRKRLGDSIGKQFLSTAEFANARLSLETLAPTNATLRIFCVPAMGQAQMELLERLGESTRIEIYHLDFLACESGPLSELISRWGRAHTARRNWLSTHETTRIPSPERIESPTRLSELQNALRGNPTKTPAPDASLELLACPGVRREVEAVRDSVVHLLETHPDLLSTDIGILVPDMTEYRPHLEAVFQRDDVRVNFNLSDTTAEDDSVYAQGVEALMALAGGRFTRREFFNLALNPCFLAAQKISRNDVMQWLDWADRLNIFREFDTGSRAELRPFSWRHALRRLRLGRIMTTGPVITAYENAVPFGDLRSADPDAVTRFSTAVERLARFCERCSSFRSASDWADLLESALNEFVAVPEDRGEEMGVRSELLRALNEFRNMDKMLELAEVAPRRRGLAFPLLRELVSASIADVESRYGHYLLDGVTISALRTDRPIPFRVTFVLGLGEGIFPGHDSPLSLDIRDTSDATHRPPSAVEANRAALLEALATTRDRIVFSYVSQNLQKDESFEPSTMLKELEETVAFAAPVRIDIPFTAASERYILKPAGAAVSLPSYRRHDLERALGRITEKDLLRLGLDATQQQRLRAMQKTAADSPKNSAFEFPAPAPSAVDECSVTIEELALFLRDPLAARLRRHLGLYTDDREDIRALEEHEPFYSDSRDAGHLIRDALESAIVTGEKSSIPEAATAIGQQRFTEQQLMGSTPGGAYGRLDLAQLKERITSVVADDSVCQRLIQLRRFASVTIGKQLHSAPDALAFPAVEITLASGQRVKISGQVANIYRSIVNGPLEFLSVSNGTHTSRFPSAFQLEHWLFSLCLRAGEAPNSDGLLSRHWMGESGCVAWLLSKKGLLGWKYESQIPEAARAILAQLAADFLDATRFEYLPLEPVQDVLEREFGTPPAPQSDFHARIQRQMDNSEDSDFGYSPPPFYRILAAQAPDDAADIYTRRIAPFLSGTKIKAGDESESAEGGGA